jgi:translation elongation factor EF-1beta
MTPIEIGLITVSAVPIGFGISVLRTSVLQRYSVCKRANRDLSVK